MAMTLPFIAVTYLTQEKIWQKGIVFITGGLSVNSLIASQTRGAFLGILVGLIYAFMRAPKGMRKTLIAYLAVGLMSIFILTNENFWNRMDTIHVEDSETRESSSQSRLEIWKGSLKLIQDYPLGVGIGRFSDYIGNYDPNHPNMASHNSFVRCYSDLGIQGLIIYLATIYLAFKTLRRIRNKLDGKPEFRFLALNAYGLEISLIIAYISGSFTERTYVEGYWLLISMVPCLDQTVRHALENSLNQDGEMI